MMPYKVAFVSLGCAKNLVNTEQMMALCRDAGHTVTGDPEGADVAVLNTCGFIESAKSEAIENILELSQLKDQGKLKKLLVAGCLTQRYPDDIRKELPEVDGMLGTGSYTDVVTAVEELMAGEHPEHFERIDRAYDDGERMVTTPWYDHEIPMTEAAELGTKKVMEDHCSIGLVVTTDGTITDIPRADYVAAEDRAIGDMKATGKPFVVVVNSREPRGEAARELCSRIQETYQVKALCADCQTMSAQESGELLRDLLYAFPMQELRVYLPRWMDGLEYDHPVKAALYDALAARAGEISEMCQAETVLGTLTEVEHVAGCRLREIDLGSGMVACELQFPESLYYDILSGKTGFDITGEGELMELLTELAQVKRSYDKIASALEEASATGYGVVMPTRGEMKLEAPEIVRKGSAYGVKLKAGAPSIHMLRVDLDTEISPMVGDEKQSQDLVNSLSEQYQTAPDQLWESNIFGKSVFEMVNDGLTTKLRRMPDDVRVKFRGSLARVVNEGATGMICIIF